METWTVHELLRVNFSKMQAFDLSSFGTNSSTSRKSAGLFCLLECQGNLVPCSHSGMQVCKDMMYILEYQFMSSA